MYIHVVQNMRAFMLEPEGAGFGEEDAVISDIFRYVVGS